MKVTLKKAARAKDPWLRVFRASGLCEEVQAADRGTDGQDRAEQDRAEQDRAEQDRAEQDRAEQDRAEQDRAEQDRAEQDRVEQDRVEQDRVEQDQAEAEMFWAGRIPAMRHSARVAARVAA